MNKNPLAGLLLITAMALLCACGAKESARAAPEDDAARGKRAWEDVKVLADDNMEGRRSGTEGHRRAANYVAEEYRKAGLVPGGQGVGDGAYLQSVQLEMRQIVEAGSSLSLVVNGQARPLKFGDDAGLQLRGNF